MFQIPLFMYDSPLLTHRMVMVKETAPAATEVVSGVEAQGAPTDIIVPEIIDQVARDFKALLTPEQRARLNPRFERGVQLARQGKVYTTDHPRQFQVGSSLSFSPHRYEVDLAARTCSCPDSKEDRPCKHRVAAFLVEKAIGLMPQVKTTLAPDSGLEASSLGTKDTQENPWLDPEMLRVIQTLISVRRAKAPIVCAIARVDGRSIPVEIGIILAGTAFVTALPKLTRDGALWPVFPFPSPFGMSVPWSTAELPITCLSNIRVQEA